MKKLLSIYLCAVLIMCLNQTVMYAESSNGDELVESKIKTLISNGSMNGFVWNFSEGNTAGQKASASAVTDSHTHISLDLTNTTSSNEFINISLNLEAGNIYKPGAYTPVSLQEMKENGFLQLTVKAEQVPSSFSIKLANQGWGWTDTTACDISGWTAGEWCNIRLPIKNIDPSFFGGGFKLSDVIRFTFMAKVKNKQNCEIDIKEISLWDKVKPTEMSFVSSKMEATTGKYVVDIKFSKNIKSDSIKKQDFIIGTEMAENVIYDYETKMCTLWFDMMPQFPSELTLKVSGNIIDGDNLPVSGNITVNNSSVQNRATFVIDPEFNVESDNSITCISKVRCLCTGDQELQDVCVYVALYEGNKIISYGFSEQKQLAWKSADTFTVNLSDISLADETSMRVEVYIIDDAINGRPLAGVYNLN